MPTSLSVTYVKGIHEGMFYYLNYEYAKFIEI